MTVTSRAFLLSILFATAGCGEPASSMMDAGSLSDAGGSELDSGGRDAGSIMLMDSGRSSDAGGPCTDQCTMTTCEEGDLAVLDCVVDPSTGCTVHERVPCGTGERCNDDVFFSVFCEAVACADGAPLGLESIETDLITAPILDTGCSSSGAGPTRVFVLTAPASGRVRVTTSAPDDTSRYYALCANREEECTGTTEITYTLVSAPAVENIEFAVVSGVPYYVIVAGSSSSSPTGRITLSATML